MPSIGIHFAFPPSTTPDGSPSTKGRTYTYHKAMNFAALLQVPYSDGTSWQTMHMGFLHADWHLVFACLMLQTRRPNASVSQFI